MQRYAIVIDEGQKIKASVVVKDDTVIFFDEVGTVVLFYTIDEWV
jgi:hypothetical protein